MAKQVSRIFSGATKRVADQKSAQYRADLKNAYDKYAPRNQTFNSFMAMWSNPTEFYQTVKSWGDAARGTVYSSVDLKISKSMKEEVLEMERINGLVKDYNDKSNALWNVIESKYPVDGCTISEQERAKNEQVLQDITDYFNGNIGANGIRGCDHEIVWAVTKLITARDIIKQAFYQQKFTGASKLNSLCGLSVSDITLMAYIVIPKNKFIYDFVSERINVYMEIFKSPYVQSCAQRWADLTDDEMQGLIDFIYKETKKKLPVVVPIVRDDNIKYAGCFVCDENIIKIKFPEIRKSDIGGLFGIIAHEQGHVIDVIKPNMGVLGEQLVHLAGVFNISDYKDDYSLEKLLTYMYSLSEQSSYAIGNKVQNKCSLLNKINKLKRIVARGTRQRG